MRLGINSVLASIIFFAAGFVLSICSGSQVGGKQGTDFFITNSDKTKEQVVLFAVDSVLINLIDNKGFPLHDPLPVDADRETMHKLLRNYQSI